MQQILIDVYRTRPEERRDLRAARRSRRRHAGVALSPRQDGRAHDRRQDRAPADRPARPTCARRSASPLFPGSVGDPVASVTADVPAADRSCDDSPSLLALPRRRAAAADRPLASGVARRRVRRAAAAWLDAAALVDDKWERAAEVADEVRAGLRRLLNDPRRRHRARAEHARAGRAVAVGGLPLHSGPAKPARNRGRARRRPTASSTRFAASSIGWPKRASTSSRSRRGRSTRWPSGSRPRSTIATACVLVSSVLFETAEIVPDLGHVAARVRRVTARALLVDAYHHLNVVPFDIAALGLSSARSSSAAATSTASSARATASCACRRAASCGR